jgi:hypothetical protein
MDNIEKGRYFLDFIDPDSPLYARRQTRNLGKEEVRVVVIFKERCCGQEVNREEAGKRPYKRAFPGLSGAENQTTGGCRKLRAKNSCIHAFKLPDNLKAYYMNFLACGDSLLFCQKRLLRR